MSVISPIGQGVDITLGAAANEEASLADKVLGDIGKLLEGLRHCGCEWRKERKDREKESLGN